MLLSFLFFLVASNPFPTEIYGSAVVQHEGTFYIIGGFDLFGVGSHLDTIYRFEISDESWRLMPNHMKNGRTGATAMMVNSSLFPTCN